MQDSRTPTQTISVIIHTKNSAKTLQETLESVRFADEILVVDMQSTDTTKSIARKFGAVIMDVDDVGYVEPARNAAIKAAKSDWICIVDSDEVVPQDLANLLLKIAQNPTAAEAYLIPRKNFVWGDWLQHAGWWPDMQLRFFKKGSVDWPSHIHAQPKVDGDVRELISKNAVESNSSLTMESVALSHKNYPDVSSFIQRLDRYTTHEVLSRSSSKLKMNSSSKSNLHSSATMIQSWTNELLSRLFVHKGVEGGMRSVGISFMQAQYELIVQLKLWEKNSYTEKQSNTQELMSQLSETKSQLAYWIADWQVQNTSGLNQVWWMIRRKLRV